jgi:hypothetical protein
MVRTMNFQKHSTHSESSTNYLRQCKSFVSVAKSMDLVACRLSARSAGEGFAMPKGLGHKLILDQVPLAAKAPRLTLERGGNNNGFSSGCGYWPVLKGEMTVKIVIRNRRRSHEHSLWICALFLWILIAGCAPVRFVGSYDPMIDRGLTEYYESMDVFLSEMERASASSSVKAKFSENARFYDESGAKIDALLMRAKAAEPKANCIGSDAVSSLAGKLLQFKSLVVATEDLNIDEIVNGLKSGEGGSCTVQILRVVRANHDLTAAIHKHNDKLTKPVVAIIRPTIEQGVRIGVTTELAKQRGEK